MTKFTIKAGKNSSILLVYKDGAGVVIDLTGASARLVAREGYYTDVIVNKAADINGPAGEIAFNFVPLDTSGILTEESEKSFKCDVELTLASGEVIDLFNEATLVLKQSIAR